MANYLKSILSPGLYFVGTPIGTARDITLRALDVLASADVLAAEDTRSLRRLMEIHGVPLAGRSVLAYHDHNGSRARPVLLQALADGKSVAYASEAGMPMIADPGFDLSRAAAQAGHMVTSAPGPTAATTALALAGLPTDRFQVVGFLPNASAARRRALEDLRDVDATLVLYESPKRIEACLSDCVDVLGAERQGAVCRELTKRFEEVRRGTVEMLRASVAERPVKGEIVLILDRGSKQVVSDLSLQDDLRHALTSMRVKDAAQVVANAHGLSKREVYQMALAMDRDK